MPRFTDVLLLSLICALVVGCAPKADLDRPVRIDAAGYDDSYDQTIQVLRDYGFRISRQDHRFGKITSYPLDVPLNIEVWSPLRGQGEVSEMAGIDHLRRIVTVTWKPGPVSMSPDEEQRMLGRAESDVGSGVTEVPYEMIRPTAYEMDIEVELQRRQIVTRRMSSTAKRRVHSDLRAVPYELNEQEIPAQYWETIGRDEAFEQKLLRSIMKDSENL